MRARSFVVTDAAAAERTGVELRRRGVDCRAGFAVPEPFAAASARTVVCSGAIDGPDAARAALLAAARGAGLVVHLDPGLDDGLRRTFLGDLARLGLVEFGEDERDDRTAPVLTAEQRELLELVADGAAIPDAAAQLYLSVRTAERRMAQARSALGVRTTAAAAVAFRAGRR